jgi:N-methylhydantoinase A
LVRARPATTLLSGPAGGPSAAGAYCAARGEENAIVMDMGGTSFDVSLLKKGEAATNNEGDIDRLKIALPMLAISTIGAGGGSIGWIDEGGLLRMGPRSAGSRPGPACYGRGGREPTCTDANLLLGYLDPDFFAGGSMPLDFEAAREAVEKHIARPLGLDVEEAAAGMYRIINTNMAHGVREITIKRGLDPREFPMVVAGGAGSLHACAIARELDIKTLIVPPTASVLCATGMLLCDLQHDFVRSFVTRFSDMDFSRLDEIIDGMRGEGERQLLAEKVPAEAIEHQLMLDLRYIKQYHEVTVPVSLESVRNRNLEDLAVAFHREHNRLYGYDLQKEGTEVELINVRLRSIGKSAKPELPRFQPTQKDMTRALKGRRRAYLPEENRFGEVPVYDGHLLECGHEIEGPALLERRDTTVFVTSSFRGRIDEKGSCRLEGKAEKHNRESQSMKESGT